MDSLTFESQLLKMEEYYTIHDLVNKDSRVIFLLESGHINELKEGFPVSGLSGKAMLREMTFNEYPYPLGKLIGTKYPLKEEDVFIRRIGLMNVCPIPMQGTAYPPHAQESFKEAISSLEGVRKNNSSSKYKDHDWNLLQARMVADLRLRILEHQDKTFIPCGKFAQKFLGLAAQGLELEILWGIPHPSYNAWSRPQYKEAMESVQRVFQSLKKENA